MRWITSKVMEKMQSNPAGSQLPVWFWLATFSYAYSETREQNAEKKFQDVGFGPERKVKMFQG